MNMTDMKATRSRAQSTAQNTDSGKARAVDTAQLEALRQRLHEDMEGLSQADGDRSPYGGDFESLVAAAQMASQHETDELLRRRLERRLEELNRITHRLQQGRYGKCESCGADIPAERLAAMPDTTLCVPCQRRKERRTSWRRAA
jgi:RNA polymerase-binding transcription factor DksA